MKSAPITAKGLLGLRLQSVHGDWMNYLKRGVGPEHIPDLLRIATDPAQFQDDSNNRSSIAARHAVRALAQLQAMEAVGPLLTFLEQCDDQDWDPMAEDLSVVLSRFGPAALPQLAAYLSDPAHGHHPRVVVADAISNLAEHDPSQRDACVAVLSKQLERSSQRERDRTLIGIIIDCLLDLEAVEAAPLMEKLFAAGMVDEEIISCWEEAQAILRNDAAEAEFEEEEYDDDPFYQEDEPDPPPGPRTWDELAAPQGKSPKECAQERAKARKKQKKKK